MKERGKESKNEYHDIQKEKDSLYEKYAEGEIDVQEYRDSADELEGKMEELLGRIEKIDEEHRRMKEESGRDKWNMKQIIRYSHLEELTQDVVDIFIKRVVAYKDKRVEIEWDFAE